MKGLDTNVLIRYLTQDDPAQSRKANMLIDGAVAKGEKLHVDVVVLCEAVWALRDAYDFDRDTIAGTIEKVLDAAQLSIDDTGLLREALAEYRAGPGDFADYVLGLRNRKAGCSATATFDRALKKSALFALL